MFGRGPGEPGEGGGGLGGAGGPPSAGKVRTRGRVAGGAGAPEGLRRAPEAPPGLGRSAWGAQANRRQILPRGPTRRFA